MRNPLGKGLLTIENVDGSITEFDQESEAEEFAEEHPLCKAWAYDIVEIWV